MMSKVYKLNNHKNNKTFIYKGEKALWSRCERCGELNIISESMSTCSNCKLQLNSYMRELTEEEIEECVEFI